jgi:long-chain acyl-CoA synthetase
VDAMYENKENVTVEAPVTYRDGRKGIVATAIKIRSIK